VSAEGHMISKPHEMETIDEVREMVLLLVIKTLIATRTVIIFTMKRIELGRQKKKSILPLLRMVSS
jgi:hypothetical protein